MQHRERDILFRLGRAHEQHQLVQEGEAQLNFVRNRMESEQRTSLTILESLSQERDFAPSGDTTPPR